LNGRPVLVLILLVRDPRVVVYIIVLLVLLVVPPRSKGTGCSSFGVGFNTSSGISGRAASGCGAPSTQSSQDVWL